MAARRPGPGVTAGTPEEIQMPLYALGDRVPSIDPTAFVHPQAVIIGAVTVGPESSIWPSAVLRADHGQVRIGAQTSVQDGAVLHCTDQMDTIVGDRVVIGHCAHLEGCTIADDALIGSGSVVLHQAVVESWAMVAAQALVSPGTVVPSGAAALGVPARIREGAARRDMIEASVATYVHNAHWYNAELRLIG